MVDVISCRYRMEGLWFIALSTATSRTCALACRINTALSVLSIRHHLLSPPLPLSHTLPFHATTHKQSFIILIPSSPYLFSAHNVGPLFYVSHYFDALAWVVPLRGWCFHRLLHTENPVCFRSLLVFATFILNECSLLKILLTNIIVFSVTDGFRNIIFHN